MVLTKKKKSFLTYLIPQQHPSTSYMCQALFHAFEIWQEMTQTKISALIELRFQWGERENLTEVHSMLNGNGTVEKGLPQWC